MTGNTEIIPPGHQVDRSEWAGKITTAWGDAIMAIFEVGRHLTDAKAALDHGAFTDMIESDLPFGARAAQMLMKIAADERITNPKHVSHLPPQWGALYQLTRVTDDTFDEAIGDGRIHAGMERRDAEFLARGDSRTRRLEKAEESAAGASPLHVPRAGQDFDAATAVPLPGRKYAVIYADPAWTQETRSDKGREKSADQHYPVMTIEELMALPVDEIAADNCALLLWTFGTHIPQALALMDAWGFDYKTKCGWYKTNADGSPHLGTGFWFRDCDEDLLLGVRGDMPAPMPGTQINSMTPIEYPGRHSEKPKFYRDMIEGYFPGVRKIEMFARDAAPGWDAWGNEVGFVDGGGA